MVLLLFNISNSFSQSPDCKSDSTNAINQIKKSISSYTSANASDVIKLLKDSFKMIGFSEGYNNISKSNIVIIPKMEIDTFIRSEYYKEPLLNVRMNLNKNQFEGIILYEDNAGNQLQIQIRKVEKHQQDMLINQSNEQQLTNFYLQIGDYEVRGKTLNASQKIIVASDYLRDMPLFCLESVSSTDGYNMGGWDIYTYIILQDEVYEANFKLLDEVKSNFEDIQELNILKLDNFKLSNIIMKYLR